MDFISLLQLQNNGVGDVFVFIISRIPVLHDGHVVKMYGHTCSALASTQHGELEIVDTLDWCCKETYRESSFNMTMLFSLSIYLGIEIKRDSM